VPGWVGEHIGWDGMIQADKNHCKAESRIASFRSILMRRRSNDLLAFCERELSYHRATGRIQFHNVSRLAVLIYQSSTSGFQCRVDSVLDCFVILANLEVTHRSEFPSEASKDWFRVSMVVCSCSAS
jgi:hypothetical protein